MKCVNCVFFTLNICGALLLLAVFFGPINLRLDSSKTVALSDVAVPDDYAPDHPLPVRRFAWSLEHEKTLWRAGHYHAVRAGGAAMWIANDDYAIAIGPSEDTEVKLANEADRKFLWAAFLRWGLERRY